MTANPIEQAYGKLQEGMHVTGYTFERACAQLIWLLQEDRWKKCGDGFKESNSFLDSVRFNDFKLVAEQRKKIAFLIKATVPEVSNTQIAKTLGVHRSTIDEDMSGGNPPQKQKKHNDNNDGYGGNPPPHALSGAEAAKLVQRRGERRERDAEAEQRRIDAPPPPAASNVTVDLRHGDFRQVLTDLKDVDAIITDPPYERDALPLLRDLADLANRVLKANGVLAVLYGHTYLPDAFTYMAGFRPYRWTACYLEEGNGYVSHARKVQSNWKPILIYGGEERFGDLIHSSGDAGGKERHKWGQNFDAFKDLIERLTRPGALVVDPFTGGGTTLFAARAAGRHFVGAEIEKNAFDLVNAKI